MAIPSTPPILPMPIADSGDVRSIPEQTPTGTNQLSFQSGFPPITSNPLTAGGVPPQREDFNAAYKLLSQHVFFQQSGGVYPWQGVNGDFPGLNYLTNNIVLGSDGVLYAALQPSGPDIAETGPQDPVSTTGYWGGISGINKIGKLLEKRVWTGTGASSSAYLMNNEIMTQDVFIFLYGGFPYTGGNAFATLLLGADSGVGNRLMLSQGRGDGIIANPTVSGYFKKGQGITLIIGRMQANTTADEALYIYSTTQS